MQAYAEIIKSQSDKRQYKSIMLGNQLRCLLI